MRLSALWSDASLSPTPVIRRLFHRNEYAPSPAPQQAGTASPRWTRQDAPLVRHLMPRASAHSQSSAGLKVGFAQHKIRPPVGNWLPHLMKFELDKFNRNVPDTDLLQDLMAVEAKLKAQGRKLTFRSYGALGKYAAGTICVRFGSWNDGLRKAGITPRDEKNVSIEALFDNLKLVWIAKGKQPVYRDMSVTPSRYTASIYNGRFGGWRNALEEFVAFADQEQNELLNYEVEVKSSKGAKRTRRHPSLALKYYVLKRDHFRCVSCGRSPATTHGLVLEIDHHVAWSKGGETIEENLKTLCFDCNRGKGAT